MQPIVITSKREWKAGPYTYMECFCNGIRLSDRCEEGGHQKMIERMKRSCSLIKATGAKTADEINNITTGGLDRRYWPALEAEVPEWEV